ncbi:MAG: helix-turn-helix domain-containing protein, partial [Acidobacteriota bacterium]
MASFGETLKRERELREISLRQIAEATKINIRYLQALEENRFDVLPGGLFNKGFIRAYSHFIGIDSEAMVNSYLQELSARLQGGGAAPVHDQGLMHRPAGVPQRRAGSRPGDAAPERSASPAITFAPHSPRLAATGATTAPRAATPAGNGDTSRSARPAIDGIEVAAQAAPRSSRALLWILSLVAAAGVLFLLLSLLRGATPSASRPADRPDPEGAGEEPGGSSELLPEISQLSHITLGTLTS